jgi:hypothetical protein
MHKLSKADKERKYEAYQRKIQEYDTMTLDELKALFETKKPGGIYFEAMKAVVEHKLNNERLEKVTQLAEENKIENLPVLSETTTDPVAEESEESQKTTN